MNSNTAIARRYAQALFMAAQKKDVVDRTWQDLKGIQEVDQRSHEQFRFLLEAPQVSVAHKFAVLDAAIRPFVHPLVVEFFRLLLNKKRSFGLRDILDEFERLAEEHAGIVRARVTSAVPLLDAESAQLLAELERRMSKKVRLVATVEPAILGGMVVRIGDEIADQSVRTQLAEMRDHLLAARVS
jgi:F-type H+-transporting ATPase subunit delta